MLYDTAAHRAYATTPAVTPIAAERNDITI
jgi:hypothetical protein